MRSVSVCLLQETRGCTATCTIYRAAIESQRCRRSSVAVACCVAGRHAFRGGTKTSTAQVFSSEPSLIAFAIDYSQVPARSSEADLSLRDMSPATHRDARPPVTCSHLRCFCGIQFV